MSWLQQIRRQHLLADPFPEEWKAILQKDLPAFARLNEADQKKLGDDLRIFLSEKNWEGCGGLELTDEIKVTISAQACLLNLHREHEYYPNVESILVYPTCFRPRRPSRNEAGVVTEEVSTLLGEAWGVGPVILSWKDSREGAEDPDDGKNVVYHEFAHKLDLTDRDADGAPLLETNEQVDDWADVMHREYIELIDRSMHGHKSLLDDYGATNAAEFFAVATETFFEKPSEMRDEHPELYRVLSGYYHQDPAQPANS